MMMWFKMPLRYAFNFLRELNIGLLLNGLEFGVGCRLQAPGPKI